MKEKLKRIKKSRIFNLFEILLFIAVCIGAGALAAFINHESDPTELAVVYFRAFVQQDYDTMYECLEIEEGSYVNKDMYKAAMKEIRDNMVIDTYDIGDAEKVDGAKQVTIKCVDSETEESQDFVIRFIGKRSGFQIIPDYYVDIDNILIKNFSVVMNGGNYLELNGEQITEKNAQITSDADGNLVYTIKGTLGGDYKVSATNQYGAIVQNITLTEENTEVNLTGNNYTANDAYTRLITENSENVIKRFYSAVRKRNPSAKKLLACFDNNKKLKETVKNYVEESQEIVYWPETKNIDSYNVIEMNMSKLKSKITYNPDKKNYKVVYNYSYDYVSSTDTALYTSYVYKISGTCKTTMTLTYTLDGEDIVLTNIKIKNTNKKD